MDKQRIIYEDKDIIVCHKPAGIATQTAKVGQRDMVSEVSNYLAGCQNQTKPYVGLVHRLDQPVEGILVFARNPKAAGELSRQMAANKMKKQYYAVIAAEDIKPEESEVEDKLKEMAKNYNKTEEEMLKNTYLKDYITSNMKYEKAIQFIIDNAKFKK